MEASKIKQHLENNMEPKPKNLGIQTLLNSKHLNIRTEHILMRVIGAQLLGFSFDSYEGESLEGEEEVSIVEVRYNINGVDPIHRELFNIVKHKSHEPQPNCKRSRLLRSHYDSVMYYENKNLVEILDLMDLWLHLAYESVSEEEQGKSRDSLFGYGIERFDVLFK